MTCLVSVQSNGQRGCSVQPVEWPRREPNNGQPACSAYFACYFPRFSSRVPFSIRVWCTPPPTPRHGCSAVVNEEASPKDLVGHPVSTDTRVILTLVGSPLPVVISNTVANNSGRQTYQLAATAPISQCPRNSRTPSTTSSAQIPLQPHQGTTYSTRAGISTFFTKAVAPLVHLPQFPKEVHLRIQ